MKAQVTLESPPNASDGPSRTSEKEPSQPARPSPALEKPQNGLAGLKHWRHDVRAGLVVSLISLPFSLGIAVASGAPPVCGLVSAIIAGLLFPFLGGPYVTISGPAAGLAPVLLASIATLGAGDMQLGYPLLLAVICMAGCVQVVLSLFKAARFCAIFPSSVVEGMLCSIGLMIIAKELPHLTGTAFHSHEFFGLVAELPGKLSSLQPQVFALGLACLALLFLLDGCRWSWLRTVPPPLTVAALGVIGGRLLGLDAAYLIHIPDHPLENGFTLPNFAGLLADSSLWGSAVAIVVTLTLIDGIESLATVMAVDKIDPFRRKSDPNRTLLAMGISNICSSVAGGLTIIPGGVKSKACIANGGRTLWANFYNAVFLLMFLFVAKDLINLIPFSALAAILIHTGYRMSEYRIWKHVTHIGREQLFVFAVTVTATLAIDLLWGIAIGTAAKLFLNLWYVLSAGGATSGEPSWAQALRLFRSPVSLTVVSGDEYHVYFAGPLVCFNMLAVQRALYAVPAGVSRMMLHVTRPVRLIDHTTCENLLSFAEDQNRLGSLHVEVLGLDDMRPASDHASAMRFAVWEDQALEMT